MPLRSLQTGLSDLADLLRTGQWFKNAFIFFPLLFSVKLLTPGLLQENLTTVLAFCLIASALYILNDLHDLATDRIHPRKSGRPLASGRIAIPTASRIAILLLATGLIVAWTLSLPILLLGAAFVLLNILYNFFSKHQVILDIFSIAVGFHIRIWAGSLAVGVEPSVGLQLCTFVSALFLGFSKRRSELITLDAAAEDHRKVLSQYTLYFLDLVITSCLILAVMLYSLYAISIDGMPSSHPNMHYSIVFVVYGMFRYLYLIHVKHCGNDPSEILFKDKPLFTCVVLWALSVFLVLYWPKILPLLS